MTEEELFDYKSCFRCEHCFLDTGLGKYVCSKTQKPLADMRKQGDVYKPTKCEMWNK